MCFTGFQELRGHPAPAEHAISCTQASLVPAERAILHTNATFVTAEHAISRTNVIQSGLCEPVPVSQRRSKWLVAPAQTCR